MHRFSLQFLPLLSALIFSVAIPLVAQTGTTQPNSPDVDLTDLYSYGDDYFFEVITMPGWGGNKSRVVVLVRLTYNLMNFRKTPQSGSTEDLLHCHTFCVCGGAGIRWGDSGL